MKWTAMTLLLCCGTLHAADVERDHRSILAMQGEYAVSYAFDETEALQPGYELAKAHHSAGSEVVILLQDDINHIVLQHILVDSRNGHVTKHWRQDWHYEAPTRFEFRPDQTWIVRELTPEQRAGKWTQCVYGVSEVPRYCGTGVWHYEGDRATWRSDVSWRPLPRREYSQRDDYNVLMAINEQTITADGWMHEQFNTKTQYQADGSQIEIAREHGLNIYQRTTKIDFTPAYTYWKETAAFWAQIRQHWAGKLSQPPGIHLTIPRDSMELIMPLFAEAENQRNSQIIDNNKISELLGRYVEPLVETN